MRPLLGTFVAIRAQAAAEQTVVSAAVESAFAAVAKVDRLMSFHRSGSDLARLNRARAGARLRVHRWTYRVLLEALRLRSWSAGAFDCNAGAPLMRAGLLPARARRAPGRRSLAKPAIRLAKDGSVRLRTTVALDLGGIAKGFAVDRAVEALQRCGMVRGLVNAGGDLRVFGDEAQPMWLRRPRDPKSVQRIGALGNGAIATSGAYFIDDNRPGEAARSAILDAARGRRVRMNRSVAVIARNCMLADALTKVAVLEGRLPRRLATYAEASIVAQ